MTRLPLHSLSVRLIAPLILFSLVIGLFLMIFFNHQADQLSHRMFQDRALELAELLVIKIEVDTSKSNLSRVMSAIGSYDDVDAIYLSNRISGRILSSNLNRYNNKNVVAIKNTAVVEALSKVGNFKINKAFFVDSEDSRQHILVYPFNAISSDKRSIVPFVITLIINNESLNQNLADFYTPTLIIQFVSLIIISGFFYIFARKIIISPINRLIFAIDHAENKESALVEDKTRKDEMGLLIERYNKMSVKNHQQKEMLIAEKERSDSAAKAKSEFLATMTHELRTPLNGVIGMSELLKEANLNTKHAGYLEIINQSGNQLLAVINDILDFSKIESGKLDLNPEYFDINQLIRNTVSMLNYQAHEKSISLSVSSNIPDNLAIVYGDDVRINQILINLISNAIKFTEKGFVTIHLKPLPNEDTTTSKFEVHVKDTGIGMSNEQLIHLFEHFHQADASTTRKYGGTGLGLAICKKLTERMNGTINVTSEPGVGTNFILGLTLPLGTKDQIRGPSNHSEWGRHHFNPADNETRILVVDDTPINLELAIALLEDEGFNTEQAENGLIALNKVKSGRYDIIIMDCLMPEMDGFESTRAIREWEEKNQHPPIPIIALTASALNETREKCQQAGMDDFITKPIDSKTLMDIVKKYLKRPTNKVS